MPRCKTKLFKGLLIYFLADKIGMHAAVISGAVKVDSGMSKGSYLHLARLVRMYSQVRGSISPGHGKNIKSSGNNIGMPPSKGSRKSIAAGERVGKEKTFVEYGTVQDPKFLFEFEINVFQYLVNENGRSGTRKAWNSIQLGRVAFLSRFKELYPASVDLKGYTWLTNLRTK